MRHIPVETFREIAQKAHRDYGPLLFYLHIYNEPLVHPRIIELLAILDAFGHTCYISSNINVRIDWEALLLSPALRTLVISASGYTQEIYERGHRGGNVSLVLRNIGEIARHTAASRANVLMNFHLYRDNAADAEAMKRLCEESGIAFSGYNAILFQNQFDSGFCAKTTLWKEHSDIIENVLPRIFLEPFEFQALPGLASIPCHVQHQTLALDHEGGIFTCFHKGPDDPHRVGDFLALSKQEIEDRKAGCPVCGECREMGWHLQFPFFCSVHSQTIREETLRFLRAERPDPGYVTAIYVFGAGLIGAALAPLLKLKGYDVRAVIDEAPEKSGTVLYGLPVIPLQEALGRVAGSLVIDTVRSMPFARRLAGTGLENRVRVMSPEHFIRAVDGSARLEEHHADWF